MRDNINVYAGLHASIVGISVDSPFTLAKFREEQNLPFDLLSDFNKDVSAAYDSLYETFAFGMKGVSKRSAFVIDRNKVIQYAEVLDSAGDVPNFTAIQETLATSIKSLRVLSAGHNRGASVVPARFLALCPGTNTFFTACHRMPGKPPNPRQTQLDLEWLVELLEFGPGDQLLDVFCGYGRHALPLARLGCTVTGVDIAEDYITELQRAAQHESLAVTAIQGDFLTVPLMGAFDAGYCLGNSFSFFPQPTMLTFLKRIAGLLRPGGRFLAHTA